MRRKRRYAVVLNLLLGMFLLTAGCTEREQQREEITPMQNGSMEPDGMDPAPSSK